jgi:GT2 family glycosyltransferase
MALDNPELSIIVISYNTKDITLDCLNSIIELIDNKLTYEIILVDNASTDQTIQIVKNSLNSLTRNLNVNIEYIENKENLGFAKANNQGVKEAKGKYILFLNSDIIVQDNAIDNLLEYYRQNENQTHFLGGKLFNKDMTPQPSCGPFYSLPVVFGALFLKGDYWGLTRYSPNQTKEVDWISGACILTKKEYFEKLNGFDENIFMYMDEIDLLYRAKKIGYRVYFYPESKFIHLGSASSGGKTYPILQVYKGFLYFYGKHYPKISVFFLKFLLKLKAVVSLTIGKLTNNQYLVKTYEQANRLVEMGR